MQAQFMLWRTAPTCGNIRVFPYSQHRVYPNLGGPKQNANSDLELAFVLALRFRLRF